MTRQTLRQWHDEWEAELAAGNFRLWSTFLIERIALFVAEKDAFALRLAERIADASDVLGKLAERRTNREPT